METTPPKSRPPAAGWPLKSLDKQDLRWLLFALIALALGSAVMLVRGCILSSDEPSPKAATAPAGPAQPERPRTGVPR